MVAGLVAGIGVGVGLLAVGEGNKQDAAVKKDVDFVSHGGLRKVI